MGPVFGFVEKISIELAEFLAGTARPDEISYMEKYKAFRLWWGLNKIFKWSK